MQQEKLVQKNYDRSNLTYDLFRKTMVMINVYYDDLHYTIIGETPTYQYTDLIGLIGLFLILFLFFKMNKNLIFESYFFRR